MRTRIARIHSRLALAVCAVPSIVYFATWQWDPYVYGFSVLGLAPVQLVWFASGLVLAGLRVPVARRGAAVVLSLGAGASAVIAYAMLKSIHWA